MESISGNIIDVIAQRIYPGTIHFENGKIAHVEETPDTQYSNYLSPGLVDAHVHVESSLLSPAEFGRAAAVHGSAASVSDPHEIANVLGIEGVEWMIESSRNTPFKIYFGAPSCVPATPFETAGATFTAKEIATLFQKPEISYLAEVMNFPGVVARNPDLMAIVDCAKKHGKRIDGHAPGLSGEDLKKYVSAGIETDHECTTLEEAREKQALGMKIAIREGSAARNFEALWPILNEHPDSVFLCSDDKHPDELIVSHINALIKRAVNKGVPLMSAFRAATVNPVTHYKLNVGLLQAGDPADLAEWDSLESLNCKRCWIDGQLVAENGKSNLPYHAEAPINYFNTQTKQEADFAFTKNQDLSRAIVALDGQLLTKEMHTDAKAIDVEKDLLKICVVNRYNNAKPTSALIHGFSLKDGAIASSVAHDSHNIVVVGTNDKDICRAVNLIISAGGGLSISAGSGGNILKLPIAGLMSDGKAEKVAHGFSGLTHAAHNLGCTLASPYMALSFMALLVIPKLKLSDKGLFDVETFSLV